MNTRTGTRSWPVYRVGLTGGVASGKSTVASLFGALGVPVLDTDLIAREVVASGSVGLQAIVAAFGPDILNKDGSLDRRQLRDIAFGAPKLRKRLEGILHPLIANRLEELSAGVGGPYQVLVVPLLIESGLDQRVDRILVVDCSEGVQRERLMVRDGESPAGADRILAAQLDRETRLGRADDVVENTGTRDELERRVRALHAMYLGFAGAEAQDAKADSHLVQGGLKGPG